MAYYDLISENDESTVVAEFEQGFFAAEAPYMSERNLEDQFVEQLRMQEYEYLRITNEDELIANLRKQLEKLNGVSFNDSEWKRFFTTCVAKPNSGILEMAPDLKSELLNYFVNMAFADGILAEKELALIYDFGDKLGYAESEIAEFMCNKVRKEFKPCVSALK